MRSGSSSRVDRRAPAFSTAWLCAIVLVTGPLIAQPVAREKPSSPQVVALERRAVPQPWNRMPTAAFLSGH